jgi:pyrimidine operon attenuation protein/uracil phosphoribosyltransferase
VGTRQTIPSSEVAAALGRMAAAIASRHRSTPSLVCLGIANAGVAVCRRLTDLVSRELGRPVPEGVVNAAFHRDDIGRAPIQDIANATEIPGDIEGATVILVDDVVFTGRTVRATLEEVFSHGRPASVELAVLVDRGHRRLPIAPDYTGFVIETSRDEHVDASVDPDGDSSQDCIVVIAPD